jgi:hypothetical protein
MMETEEMTIRVSLMHEELEGTFDVPANIASDGASLFRWIMDNIEVDWDN